VQKLLQAVPQPPGTVAPQWSASPRLGTHTPPQRTSPGRHAQVPAAQCSMAAHVVPHPPQFFGSSCVETQVVPHLSKPGTSGVAPTHLTASLPSQPSVPSPQVPQLEPGGAVSFAQPPQALAAVAPLHTRASVPEHASLPPQPHASPTLPTRALQPPHSLLAVLLLHATPSIPAQTHVPAPHPEVHGSPGFALSAPHPPHAFPEVVGLQPTVSLVWHTQLPGPHDDAQALPGVPANGPHPPQALAVQPSTASAEVSATSATSPVEPSAESPNSRLG